MINITFSHIRHNIRFQILSFWAFMPHSHAVNISIPKMHYYIDCTPQWSPHSSPLALRRSQAELNNPQCTEAVCTTYCKSGNDIAEPKGAMWRGVQEKPAIVLSTSWMFPKMSMPKVL